MNHITGTLRPESVPAKAAGINEMFYHLFNIVDLIYDFIGIFNAVLEALLNLGDYLNGQ